MGADIVLSNIKKQYKEKVVLDQFSATFLEGKTTCIMGPSGVGKTTLLNLILKLENPDSGTITGIDKKTCAAVFQEDRLCEEFDAITNVMIAVSSHISEEQIREEFEKVHLSDYERKPVSSLSGGMKRRVAIVRAVLADSELIVLDEPLKGFDRTLKMDMLEYLKEALKGKTAILVTHEKEEASTLGDIIIEL
ncbi:MAG: ATP-binding cassette domain-containing protein [Clostridiales bacterium]|nr:ATP-binding cassette domain-containing protein [Clostridiales bacterium]